MGGSFWTRNWFEGSKARTIAQVAFLLGLGLVAVVLHVSFRLPLQLHGRHGVEWMALLLLGRLSVNRRWSASTVGLGAASASFLPYWGFKDPLMPLLFLLPGLIVDGGFRLFDRWGRSLPFLLFAGALAHASKPLVRGVGAATFGLKYGFLKDGLLYGVFLHLVFGAVGGLLAYLYVIGSRRLEGRSDA